MRAPFFVISMLWLSGIAGKTFRAPESMVHEQRDRSISPEIPQNAGEFPFLSGQGQFTVASLLAHAGMAESVDAADSKSAGGNAVGVRVPLPAPFSAIAEGFGTISCRSPFLFTEQNLPGPPCPRSQERHWLESVVRDGVEMSLCVVNTI